MTIRTRPRLRDRVRRRIPESCRLQLNTLLGSNVRLRRLVLAVLENHREAALIRLELAGITRPWSGFVSRSSTIGYSERVVEIPWVISRYQRESRVLDVGTAFAVSAYVQGLTALGISDLHGVDIAPVRLRGVKMVRADVRRLPFPTDYFGLVYCVSTLEHIGRDHDHYGGLVEVSERPDVDALREMRRVLAAGGRLLVTVPFGRLEVHPWMKQYDLKSWRDTVADADLRIVESDIYGYFPDAGWKRVPEAAQVADRAYAGLGSHAATAVICAVLSR